jgi:cephalosporin-C deacetylase
MKKILIFSLLFMIYFCSVCVAQPSKELVNVIVAPDHFNWEYKIGEKVKFAITILQNGNFVKGAKLNYSIIPEKMKKGKCGTLVLENGTTTIDGGTMSVPGFLRCTASVEINGQLYSDFATAGFNIYQIKPTTNLPKDFTFFWENAKNDLAKIPVEASITLLPDRCTANVDVYHVGIRNIYGRIYGVLCKPKKKGKYPALLHVPGAGVRPYYGNISDAEKGIITLEIGIHGIPQNLDAQVYNDLSSGALRDYWTFNLDDKDKYYYKRVYLGCVRAIDYIFSLPEFDGENIAVTGGSQGGALSIVTASLDSRVKYLAAYFPALCDVTGYLKGRAGGWPDMFLDEFTNKKEKIEVSRYYDVVNFARFIKIPGFYSWGFNDDVCSPTSTFSAYNVIEAPKEIHVFPNSRHWTYPEAMALGNEWLLKKLKR